jgi:hypothetical protein
MEDPTPLEEGRLPVGLIDETAGDWSSLFFSLSLVSGIGSIRDLSFN